MLVKVILAISTLVGHADQFYKLYKVTQHFAEKAQKKQIIKTNQGYKVKQPVGARPVLDNLIKTVEQLEENYLSYTK